MSWDNAKEVQTNWVKFEKVGDSVQGTLTGKQFQKGDAPFPDQWIYHIKDKEGIVWNVGISAKKSGTVGRLANCKIGELVGIKYDKEIPPQTKGFHPTKQLTVVSWGMDPDFTPEAGEVSVDDLEF